MRKNTIVVTRPEPESQIFLQILQEEGRRRGIEGKVRYLALPLIRIEEVHISKSDVLRGLECEWVLFTSARAVEQLALQLQKYGLLLPPNMKIGALGPATAQAGREHFEKEVSFLSSAPTGEAFGRSFVDEVKSPTSCFLPLSERAGISLVSILEGAQLSIFTAPLYRPVVNELLENKLPFSSPLTKELVLTFFSPSAFYAFQTLFGKEAIGEAAIAAFGATTARAVQEGGHSVEVVGDGELSGFAEKLFEYVQRGE